MRTQAAMCVVVGALAHVAVACQGKPAPAGGSPSAASSPSAAPSAPASAAVTAVASPAPTAAPDSIAAQHVLVAYRGADRAPKGITRSKADAKKRAEEVSAKAKSGADFTALVNEYSDDAASKERLGSLGKFKREQMAKAFSEAAFALAVGEVSPAVETPFGFHVIKRNQ